MRLRIWLMMALGVLVSSLALSGCGANPAAQAEPAAVTPFELPTPPPMPTNRPQTPTPTTPPVPTQVASVASAALLSTDFSSSDLSAWSVIDAAEPLDGPSVWAVANGELQQVSAADDGRLQYTTALVTGASSWTDYRVQVSAFNIGNDLAGVVLRASDSGYYLLQVEPGKASPNVRVQRYDAASGSWTTLASADVSVVNTRQWYTLAFQAQGSTLTGSIDGQAVISAQDSTLTAGRAGVAGAALGDLSFDQFSVHALSAE